MWWEIEFIQCLVYHDNEGLSVVPMEGANDIAFGLTREDHLDQGDEFVGSKHLLDQTFTGCNINVEVGVEAVGQLAYCIGGG